jgi:hypothetical protein
MTEYRVGVKFSPVEGILAGSKIVHARRIHELEKLAYMHNPSAMDGPPLDGFDVTASFSDKSRTDAFLKAATAVHYVSSHLVSEHRPAAVDDYKED